MEDIIVAVIIAAFPTILHYQFLIGRSLLERISTSFAWFNLLFNRWPLIFSILAGGIAGIGFLLKEYRFTYAIFGSSLFFLILDWIGCSISLFLHLKKQKK